MLVYECHPETYLEVAKRWASKHKRRCINGEFTSPSKCVGFCQYSGHPGFLTEKLRRQHDCCGKCCEYYLKKEKEQLTEFQLKLNSCRKLLADY